MLVKSEGYHQALSAMGKEEMRKNGIRCAAGLGLFGLVGMSGVTLAPQSAYAGPREPKFMAGKCAKAVGGKYDPVRKGWYTAQEIDPNWTKCMANPAAYGVR